MSKHRMTQDRLDRMVGWIIRSAQEEIDNLEECEKYEEEEALNQELNAILAIVLNKWKKEPTK